MATELNYRMFREEDLPAVSRLWDEAGWGQLSAETWRQWFVETPYGPCLVSVAVDEAGEVVGQMVFTPTLVWVNGVQARALRLSAPILRGDERRKRLRSPDHPVIRLYYTVIDEAVKDDYGIVYAVPDAGWLPFFRWLPKLGFHHFAQKAFPCMGLSVPAGRAAEPPSPSGLLACQEAPLGEEYEALWQEARESFPIPCGIVRNRQWLSYKHGGNLALAVRECQGNRLLGYAAIRRKENLLVDYLARTPDDLARVVTVALGQLAAGGSAGVLRAMDAPALGPTLRALGFTPVDYNFAFVCHTLDPRLPPEDDLLSRWYLTPGE
jgi:hypothetical protein